MGVMRLGYVHARQTDLAKGVEYYTDTLGMKVMHTDDQGRVYLKAWDEYDHHSVVLEDGGVGLVKLGYKCETPDDLAVFEKRLARFGCSVERMSAGDNAGIGDGVRVVLPSEHVLELYSEAEYVGNELGLLNPAVAPRHPIGASVPRLEHAVITTTDAATVERLFAECLGFHASERIIDNVEDQNLIGSFMFCGNSPHDIAIMPGPNGKLHHFAFHLEDWSAILRAGQVLGDYDVPIDEGPKQHGITRGMTIYMFDPAGNRNEVFAGGYATFPDFKTITWTSDQLTKGVFYVGNELSERFLNTVT
ncbi:catechol 2,3-dioxygenase [Nocardia kruczakiae]|uniref:Catechol 2,3-dioxygenase n=1 Tax=Nocardia kruczakiae TaxID=261477 RepID=A0ABU1XSU3_9NOCA|nr:catechol 2,3-dioxygenase [Nocardia kruczakiae]MDR7173052.1 catechol 2,3-dioxygenase [Nocardia kruczakiae]